MCKGVLLLALLLLVSAILLSGSAGSCGDNKDASVKGTSISDTSISVLKIKNAFNYVVANIEQLLTKNGLIKVLLIIAPLCCVYGQIFSFEPVEELLQSISLFVSSVTFKSSEIIGKIHGSYGYGYELGKADAIINHFWEYPISSIKYLFINGIPLMFKSFFKLS